MPIVIGVQNNIFNKGLIDDAENCGELRSNYKSNKPWRAGHHSPLPPQPVRQFFKIMITDLQILGLQQLKAKLDAEQKRLNENVAATQQALKNCIELCMQDIPKETITELRKLFSINQDTLDFILTMTNENINLIKNMWDMKIENSPQLN